jgi:hypothetical protein
MRPILAVLALVSGCLFLIAVSLFQLHDGTTLTSPPEAVAENFMRELATHRYSQALKYLDDDLSDRTSVADLKRVTDDLEGRVGKIRDVRGEPIMIANNDAEAKAVLKTTRTQFHTVRFNLSRRSGVWLIDAMHF